MRMMGENHYATTTTKLRASRMHQPDMQVGDSDILRRWRLNLGSDPEGTGRVVGYAQVAYCWAGERQTFHPKSHHQPPCTDLRCQFIAAGCACFNHSRNAGAAWRYSQKAESDAALENKVVEAPLGRF